MPKNYTWRWVDENFGLSVHTAINPSIEEWGGLISDLEQNHQQLKGTLVYTEGGSPSAFQRRQLRDVLLRSGEPSPSAVLTRSALARAAITALNLFLGGTVKAFPPEDIDKALTFIRAPREKWPAFKKKLEEAKQDLGICLQFGSRP